VLWRWELTPLEAFHGFRFVRHERERVEYPEWAAFKSDRYELEAYPGLTFQLGVSDNSRSDHIIELRKEQPELPVSGDKRSGVIVHDGDRLVASYVIDGRRPGMKHIMGVEPDYQGRKLGLAMMMEWAKRTKRPRVMERQTMNGRGARAFLAAQVGICRWAVDEGMDVPLKVVDELQSGGEQAIIQAHLDEVERTGVAHTLGG
jgi:GNAT superfamily N-acetyltransferase